MKHLIFVPFLLGLLVLKFVAVPDFFGLIDSYKVRHAIWNAGVVITAFVATWVLNRVLVRRMSEATVEYVPAKPDDFPKLDGSWYAQCRKTLEAAGFTHLGGAEDIAHTRVCPSQRTLQDWYVSGNVSTNVNIYQIGSFFRFYVAETIFDDGTTIVTTNAWPYRKLPWPPQIDIVCHKDTSLDEILAEHEKRVTESSKVWIKLTSFEQVMEEQARISKMKSDYIKSRRFLGVL